MHPQLIPRRRIGLCRFPRFVSRKLGKTTRTVSWFRRESRSYTRCVAHSREDRPAPRTWPFLSILKTDPPQTDRILSFSSICATITLLRSPNASSTHLISGSLLLPPFTQRSARNSVEKNVNRHLRFPNGGSPVDGSDFTFVFLDSVPFLGKRRETTNHGLVGFVERPWLTAREDRPARRTWPFLSILKTDPP